MGGGLEAALAAALRSGGSADVVAEGERLAVASFRDARDTGAHRARTRRRDDWRPHARTRRGRPHPRPSLKATLSLLAAGFVLGGVAVALWSVPVRRILSKYT